LEKGWKKWQIVGKSGKMWVKVENSWKKWQKPGKNGK
jgi:hypothetical protein